MATNIKTEPISLNCELCSEMFTDPLMLPCLHSFCKKCLIKVADEQGASDNHLKCPTCDTNVSIPSEGITAFPQNLWLGHQVNVQEYMKKMDSKNSIPCDRCVKRANGSAVAFCCQCCFFLCSSCKEDHQWWRETVKHELVEIGEKKSNQEANEIPHIDRKPMFCALHKDEKLKFFCNDCEVLSCRDCILIKHKDHNIGHYDRVAESGKEELKECLLKCVEVTTSVDDAITEGEEMHQRIQLHKKEVDKEINQAFSSLQVALKTRCKALLAKSDQIAISKSTAINIQLEAFQKLKTTISHATNIAMTAIETHQSGELLSTKKLIKDQLIQCVNEVQKMSFALTDDEKSFTYLDTNSMGKQISEFGDVSVVEASFCLIETGVAVHLATVGKERKFKISILNSTGGKITGDVPFYVLLVKVDGDKQEEKVIITNDNSGYTTISCTPQTVGEYELSLKIQGEHFQFSPYRMWVKQPKNYSSLHNQRNFNLGYYTYGVAVHPNGEVYATGNGGYIHVFDTNGTQTRTIGSPGNNDGQFSSPFGLVLLGDVLYVTDNSLNRVQKFLATTGEYLGKFDGQFSSPWGITHDGKGQILVADHNNRRVQIFKADGSFVQSIDCNGQNPSDVAVDNDSNIHVTYYSQHIVQVFTPDGSPLCTYNNPNGNFQHPCGIAIDDEGNRFITTQSQYRYYLHVLNAAGNEIKVLSGFNQPYGVALDTEGCIYVAVYGNSRIMKY